VLLVVGSITDGQLVREAVAAVDACIHLAAIDSVGRFNEEWAGWHAVNQSAFVALLQFVARRPKGRIPLAYASSAAVYGNSTRLPICETAVARPLSGYDADKLGCESHARAAGEAGGVATFGLRFFNVYGVGQRPESPYAGVVSIFAGHHPARRAAQHLWRREPKPRFRSRGRRRSSCARGISAHVDYRPDV
jgi:UDP-glucose 4-epimerase